MAALKRGPHKFATKHAPFLREEFSSVVEKGQWVVIPYLLAKRLLVLMLSLSGVKVERDSRPFWIGNYSYFETNAMTLPVACLSSMQYSHVLDHLLHKIVFADPDLGYVYLLKADVLDGFYRIGLRPEDAPNLGLIFLDSVDEESMVTTPLTFPMVWKNSPPYSVRPQKR